MKTRGFEILEEYKMAAIALPQRKTGSSAGYDIAAAAAVSLADVAGTCAGNKVWLGARGSGAAGGAACS